MTKTIFKGLFYVLWGKCFLIAMFFRRKKNLNFRTKQRFSDSGPFAGGLPGTGHCSSKLPFLKVLSMCRRIRLLGIKECSKMLSHHLFVFGHIFYCTLLWKASTTTQAQCKARSGIVHIVGKLSWLKDRSAYYLPGPTSPNATSTFFI